MGKVNRLLIASLHSSGKKIERNPVFHAEQFTVLSNATRRWAMRRTVLGVEDRELPALLESGATSEKGISEIQKVNA